MKKILYYIALVSIMVISCETDDKPRAKFTASENYIEPLEFIHFTNLSRHYDFLEWDFGDGTVSNDPNPSHMYLSEGTYMITLLVQRGAAVDMDYLQIEVQNTILEVRVIDYHTEDLIVGLPVSLHTNEYDWVRGSNKVIQGRTNFEGLVVFKGIDSRSYYILAEDKNYTNYYLGDYDNGYVLTLPLYHATYNTFDAFVEYDPVKAPTNERMKLESSLKKSYLPYEERKENLNK